MPVTVRSTAVAVLVALSLAGAVQAAPPPTAPATDPVGEAIEPLLAGEFALQSGKLDEATRWYLDAARTSQDRALAERATRIALLAKDDARAAEALALWRRLGGSGHGLTAAEATLALRKGQERAARKHLTSLLHSGDQEGWRHALSVLGSGAGEPAQSSRLLTHILDRKLLPNDLQAWLAFGGLAQRLDQAGLAERIVAEVVRRFPGEPRVALLRASQLREAGKTEEAKAALDAVVDRAASDAGLRLALAQEYAQLGDPRRAEAILAAGPQDDESYAHRAALLARAEDKEGLGRLYDELARGASRPDPQRRLLLGQIAEFLDRHEQAIDWYSGVPSGPLRWLARLRTANVLHELGRGAEGYKALRDLQADGAAPDEARRDAYLLEASLLAKDRNDAGELDAFARGLAAFPDDLEILYARALGWERRDDIARAEADFRKILVVEPDSVAALNALGYTLADRTDRHQEALELIDRARTAEPDNAAIIDSYGWVLYRLGRLQDALVELRRAFTLQKDPEIAAHLGEVLWKLGKTDEARKYFEEGRKLDPDNRSLKRALENVGA